MNTVEITIDGRTIEATEGSSVLEAALAADVYIPHLCHSPGLKPYGACRLCIVEIDGMRGMPASCTATVADGMVVRSDVEQVNKVRRMTCEMLIADHPDECLTCTGNQDCDLQRVASYLGVKEKRLRKMEREQVLDDSNPFFRRDLSRCILCGLCTRACREHRCVDAIEIAGRGYESTIAAGLGGPILESTCVSCGECVDRCPTNALAAKNESLEADKEVKTTCIYCGVGCGLVLGVRPGRVVSVKGDTDHCVNRGSLCVKGRFGLDFVGAEDRLTTPLIKRNGKFEEATWDEALNTVADKFRAIKAEHGADALAGLSSAKCTNEENYLFQKLMRAAIGTNNVDHCARLCHAST
ncbi:MAG: (2Fe-2S)-binding protein, partial [Lentisphaerae bacterium]|nr:(2Fe-2S)-binding protein [Lentisphaerota bacterium]